MCICVCVCMCVCVCVCVYSQRGKTQNRKEMSKLQFNICLSLSLSLSSFLFLSSLSTSFHFFSSTSFSFSFTVFLSNFSFLHDSFSLSNSPPLPPSLNSILSILPCLSPHPFSPTHYFSNLILSPSVLFVIFIFHYLFPLPANVTRDHSNDVTNLIQ